MAARVKVKRAATVLVKCIFEVWFGLFGSKLNLSAIIEDVGDVLKTCWFGCFVGVDV